jgi:NAD(P)-dependent dehydrogenase (short-subunit alcohol dehydrogenase family)
MGKNFRWTSALALRITMAYRLKNIADQVIVVTGASSGIGLATACKAAAKGARVVLAARNEAALQSIVRRIEANGGRAIYVVADVAKLEDLRNVVEAAISTFGGFDSWVNNAGIGVFGRLDQVSDSDNRRLFDVNFWGLVYGTQIAAAHLRRKGGAIINLGSVVSDVGFPVQGMYAASKHAIKGFSDAYRMELQEAGAPISLTLIKPTSIDTPFPRNAKNYLDQEPKLPPPVYRPEDVADAIIHAAQHGGRDYYIGGAGKLVSTINKHFPALIDFFGARTIPGQCVSGQPPARAPDGNMYGAGVGGDIHGCSPHHVMTSLYTKASMNPGVSGALLTVAGLAASALLGLRTPR